MGRLGKGMIEDEKLGVSIQVRTFLFCFAAVTIQVYLHIYIVTPNIYPGYT